MSAPSISTGQIKAIHTLKSRAKLDDDTYRDFLERETGRRSSTQLSLTEAVKVIDRLKTLSKDKRSPAEIASSRKPRTIMQGPYAGKLRALWISGWHLGIVRDRRDSALIAFVSRQTKIDHIRWLREPRDAMKAIEALKSWLARAAGVVWGGPDADPKAAVVHAQLRILGRLATGEPMPDFGGTDLNQLMTRLGSEIREAKS